MERCLRFSSLKLEGFTGWRTTHARVKIMMLCTLLLLVVYEIVIVKIVRTTTLSIVNIPTTYNQTYFPALVWPRRESVETNDRISNQLELVTDLNWSSKSKAKNLKLIYLVPDANYGDPLPEGQHHFKSERCPAGNQTCSITMKRKDLINADAVYFQRFNASMPTEFLPKPKNQVWIVFVREPPPISSKLRLLDTRALGDLVNWTITYRRDATIPFPYAKFVAFRNFTRIEDYRLDEGVNYAAGKTKKVAWLVSNCNFGINSGRENYAGELAKYISIDIYGRCGKLNCSKEKSDECLQMVKRDYKFYLAFENNCCRDYITEKFFRNALLNDVIPIVLGAHPDDYKALAPPGSYIHVDDFESPKQLADYLHLLDKNDTLYNEYFRWKKTGQFISTSPWCRLCALLHANDDGSYVYWYQNFETWWEGGMCLSEPKAGHWQSWRNEARS